MTTETAMFVLTHQHCSYTVMFLYEGGKPTTVQVQTPSGMHEYDNRLRAYKACVAHCEDLIKRTLGVQADRLAESTRRKNAKRTVKS